MKNLILKWFPLLLSLSLALIYFSYCPILFDLTNNKNNTLSQTTVTLLQNIKEPLKVSLYTNSPDESLKINKLIRQYQQIKSNITTATLEPMGADKVVITLDGKEETIRLLDKNFDENQFTHSLFVLARKNYEWVAYVTGHGEGDPFGYENMDFNLFTMALKNQGLKVEPLLLSQTESIPDNISLLIIASPKTSFLPKEQTLLENYIDKGGNLLWLSGPDETPTLSPLMNKLGINKLQGVVIDAHGKRLGTPHPAIAIIDKYPNEQVVHGMTMLTAFPWANALYVEHSIQENDFTIHPILTTHKESWTETGPLQHSIQFNPELGEKMGPFHLGFILEKATPKKQHLAIIGNSRFLANAAIGNYGNLALGLSLTNWLTQEENLMNITYPEARDLNITLSYPIALLIKYGFTAGLPIILALSGMIVVGMRYRRSYGAIRNIKNA